MGIKKVFDFREETISFPNRFHISRNVRILTSAKCNTFEGVRIISMFRELNFSNLVENLIAEVGIVFDQSNKKNN